MFRLLHFNKTIVCCNKKWLLKIFFLKILISFIIGRIPSSSASDPDIAHDYAEIYTPSREKVAWPRAPTPPLHRFPSWEDRIYQVSTSKL